MVLTFTGSLSVAEAGHAEVREMLLGALGCNLAWGIIDGVFYLMGCMAERGRALGTLLAVRRTTDPQEGPPAHHGHAAAASRFRSRARRARDDAPPA
jgi:hypothetical protein